MTLVTIGIPAFNQDKHIGRALAALRAQDFGGVEILISDNGSSDRTKDICAAAAVSDSRIRLIVQEANVGVANNYRLLFDSARGEYFMWAAADDRVSLNYVSRLVSALRENPFAVLASGQTFWTDASGAAVGDAPALRPPPTGGGTALGRLGLLLQDHSTNWLYGVYRRSAIAPLMERLWRRPIWGGDLAFLHYLCLNRVIVGDDLATLYKRRHDSPHRPGTSADIVRYQSWLTATLLGQALSADLGVRDRLAAGLLTWRYLRARFITRDPIQVGRLWFRGGLEIVGAVTPRAR